jgi:hypothetical protein
MSTPEGPDNGWSFAAHTASGFACGYVPLLTRSRLVQKHDPAWQLPELGDGRIADALQRHVTARAAHDLHHRQPGYGLGYHHSVEPRGEIAGFPDVTCWAPRPAALLFRELKGMGEDPRPTQVATLTGLAATGADVGVWWSCCWYSGRVDRELAALAGVSYLIGQHWAPGLPPQPGQPGHVPWTPEPPAAPASSSASTRTSPRARRRAEQLAPTTPRPPRPPVELPGAELPPQFAEGCPAYVVPMPGTAQATDAGVQLDEWLRAHGFPPTVVPYPVRVIDGPAGVAVQCRVAGPAGPRVWRWAPKLSAVPSRLLDALAAETLYGPAVAELLTDTDPASGRAAA